MKTQKEFIEAVMDGKTLRCGENYIKLDGTKITVHGPGFVASGSALSHKYNSEDFITLTTNLGVPIMCFYIADWVIA